MTRVLVLTHPNPSPLRKEGLFGPVLHPSPLVGEGPGGEGFENRACSPQPMERGRG